MTRTTTSLEGKVALITGAARGQGAAHARRFAAEGASTICLDLCGPVASVGYELASESDLADVIESVRALGGGIVARKADVRDFDAVQAVVDEGVREFGRLDFVVCNAGIAPLVGPEGQSRQAWFDCIDIMLTGAYNTIEAALPTLLRQDQGGAIVITSSNAGLVGMARGIAGTGPGLYGYAAAKHGVVGLMRTYANALAPSSIRVNTIHPTGVNTPMVANELFGQFVQDNPIMAEALQNALPVDVLEPEDIANAVVWLCSDEARYITGTTLPVDAGNVNRR